MKRVVVLALSLEQDMLFATCDPDSFYRALQFDGELDSCFENQPGLDKQ